MKIHRAFFLSSVVLSRFPPEGCRYLVATLFLALFISSAQAVSPSGRLNDTGQRLCIDGYGGGGICSVKNAVDKNMTGQDGLYGRDPASENASYSGFSKPSGSGGNSGFSFTPLDLSGNPIALTGDPPIPSSKPRCIKDNVTNLIWENKTLTAEAASSIQDYDLFYLWGSITGGGRCKGTLGSCNTDQYIAAINSMTTPLCGLVGWRLPTVVELQSIIDYGKVKSTLFGDYIRTGKFFYWTSESYLESPTAAWVVSFDNGEVKPQSKVDYTTAVILVHDPQ